MDTNRGFAYDEHQASAYDRGTIAAIFDRPDQAKSALNDLHEAGFHRTWMGVTSASYATSTSAGVYDREADDGDTGTLGTQTAGDHLVETVAGGGFGASLARFFGENTQQSLHEALVKQGVPASDALAVDDRMHDGGAVITVQVDDRYDEAVQILQLDRGVIASSGAATEAQAAVPAATTVARAPVAPVTSDAAYAAPTDTAPHIDNEKTIALREERLAIDKERVSAGAATIEKRVITENASVDVPVIHEELFIQRRPVTGSAPSGAIGTDETIRVPLMREQVVVDKRTFVAEEVVVGKRAVTATQRVDATVAHEELVVEDTTAALPKT